MFFCTYFSGYIKLNLLKREKSQLSEAIELALNSLFFSSKPRLYFTAYRQKSCKRFLFYFHFVSGMVIHVLTNEEWVMDCSKCGGYVIQETFFQRPESFIGWRCLNCGRIMMRIQKSLEQTAFSSHYYQSNNPPLERPIIKKYLK